MKIGLEDKKKVGILVVLLVIVIACVIYFVNAVFGGGSPPPAATATSPSSESPAPPSSPRTPGSHVAQKIPALATLDPTLHPELMAGAESLTYSGSGRNIFSMESAPPRIEAVKGPVRMDKHAAEVAQGPPPPPPIDLKFFGYEAAGGEKKAFLLHGDDVFIASEGDVVDHHYKILRITPLNIQVTDLLYNNTQTLPLTQS